MAETAQQEILYGEPYTTKAIANYNVYKISNTYGKIAMTVEISQPSHKNYPCNDTLNNPRMVKPVYEE